MNKTMHIFSITFIVCVVAIKTITAKPPITAEAKTSLDKQLMKAARADNGDLIKTIITKNRHTINWLKMEKPYRDKMPIETLIRYYNSIWVGMPTLVPTLYKFKRKKQLPAERELVRNDMLTLIKKVLSEQKDNLNKELNDNNNMFKKKKGWANATIDKQKFWANLLCSDQDILRAAQQCFNPKTWSNTKLQQHINKKTWWLNMDT